MRCTARRRRFGSIVEAVIAIKWKRKGEFRTEKIDFFMNKYTHTHTRKTTNDDDRRREIKHEIMKIEEEEEEGEKEHRKQRRSMKICSKYMDWNSNGKFILHSIYSNFFRFSFVSCSLFFAASFRCIQSIWRCCIGSSFYSASDSTSSLNAFGNLRVSKWKTNR